MAFLGALGPLRRGVRSTFYDVCRRALGTDDGRRLLADSLIGITRPGRLPDVRVSPAALYSDLPGAQGAPGRRRRPVFVTARFRSGSTLLWNLFRHVPGCTAFYEPLNERRWFDPATRGSKVDATHLGVSDYWLEYDGLASLGRWYRDEWTSRRLFMNEDDEDADLAAYIGALVDAAPSRAVLQFNRVDLRLPWLRRCFPDAVILHLYRHPRDQWCSTLIDPARVPRSVSIDEFGAHDEYYLLAWARDLAYNFPFLDPRTATHPYELFYYLWRLSLTFGFAYADASFSFERLCDRPDEELPQVMRAAGIDEYPLAGLTALISRRTPDGRWREYAPDEWFAAIEARCEDVLLRHWPAPSREANSLFTTAVAQD